MQKNGIKYDIIDFPFNTNFIPIGRFSDIFDECINSIANEIGNPMVAKRNLKVIVRNEEVRHTNTEFGEIHLPNYCFETKNEYELKCALFHECIHLVCGRAQNHVMRTYPYVFEEGVATYFTYKITNYILPQANYLSARKVINELLISKANFFSNWRNNNEAPIISDLEKRILVDSWGIETLLADKLLTDFY